MARKVNLEELDGEKFVYDDMVVIVDLFVIAGYTPEGERITVSGADYYFWEGGYDCKTSQEAADKFHENFSRQ